MSATLDGENVSAVYLCQVGERVSCGACCGLYNVADLSRDSLEDRLARRTVRLNGLGDRVAFTLGDLRDPTVLPDEARFDLVTEMIKDGKEFTKLEGLIAARYAAAAGEPAAVCRVLMESMPEELPVISGSWR